MLMIVPLMIWSTRSEIDEPGVQERDEHAGQRWPRARPISSGRRHAEDRARAAGPRRPTADDADAYQPTKAADQHDAFEADVDDAGSLAHHAAQGAARVIGTATATVVWEMTGSSRAHSRRAGRRSPRTGMRVEGARGCRHHTLSATVRPAVTVSMPARSVPRRPRSGQHRGEHVDHEEQQDDRLEGVDELRRHAGLDLHRPRARPHRRRAGAPAKSDADRIRATEQGDGDRIEADGRVIPGRHLVDRRRAGCMLRRGPQSMPAMVIVRTMRRRGLHPAVPGRVGVGPGGPDLEAQRGAVEQEPDDRHHRDGDEDAEVARRCRARSAETRSSCRGRRS